MDTDMSAGFDVPKAAPATIAGLALDGVECGAVEVLADDMTRQAKATLSLDRVAGEPTATSAWF